MGATKDADRRETVRLERAVRHLVGSRDATPFELAEQLLKLKAAAPADFGRIVSELDATTRATGARGASRRRLLYLVDVAQVLPLDEYRDRLRQIGWTKATAIADVVKAHGPDVDLDHLFHLAETHTVPNLRRLLAEGEAVTGMRCVQLRFTPEQYEQVAAALRRHGAKPARGRGLRGMEDALMRLLTETANTGAIVRTHDELASQRS